MPRIFLWKDAMLTIPMLWRSSVSEKKYYSFPSTPSKAVLEVDFREMGCFTLWFRQNLGFLPPEFGLTIYVNGYPAKVYSGSLGLRPFSDVIDIKDLVASGVNTFQVELWSSLPAGLPRYVVYNVILDSDVEPTLQRVESPPSAGWSLDIGGVASTIINILYLVIVIRIIPLVAELFRELTRREKGKE